MLRIAKIMPNAQAFATMPPSSKIYAACLFPLYLHAHTTREADTFYVIFNKINVRAFSIQVYDVELWNDFSLDRKNCQTLAIFEINIKHS